MRRRQRLPPTSRLLERREFQQVERSGRRIGGAHFIVLVRARQDDRRRLGITVTRRVGGSVVRNRIKRLIREVFRRQRDAIAAGDMVVIARRSAAGLSHREVTEELSRLWAASEPRSIR